MFDELLKLVNEFEGRAVADSNGRNGLLAIQDAKERDGRNDVSDGRRWRLVEEIGSAFWERTSYLTPNDLHVELMGRLGATAPEVHGGLAQSNVLKAMVAVAERTLQCNCDLDNWQPEKITGHSWVCRIHKTATHRWSEAMMGGGLGWQ